jgi:membrane protein
VSADRPDQPDRQNGSDAPGAAPPSVIGEEPPTQAPAPSASFLAVRNPKGSIERIPVVGFLWRLYRGYSRRNGPLLSAGIAYYALFSMGPLFLLTLQITGRLFGNGPPSPQVKMAEVLSEYLGADLANMLATTLQGLNSTESYTFAIVSLGILLYGATRLFVRLQASFNIMWDVRVVSRSFSWRRLMSRLAVFGLILIPTVLLLIGLVLSTAVTWLDHLIEGSNLLVTIAGQVIPFVVSWLALWVIYVVLPDIHLRLRDCWFSSLLVAISWAVVTRVFSTYLSFTGSQKYAGAVGALVGVIFWVDILSIAALLGVRFCRALYVWRGKTIEPYHFSALLSETPDADLEAPKDGPGAEPNAESGGGPAAESAAGSSAGSPNPPSEG